MENFLEFSSIEIELAAPDYLKERSNGEVRKPETINYRTFKPEQGSLFCERIFGPTKDWECYCGKYKTIKYQGVKCEKCNVEVTHSKVRRERMGHIELVTPVSHIWFYKGSPSPIAVLLDLKLSDLDDVLYYSKYIVVESKKSKETGIEVGQLMDEDTYRKNSEEFRDQFVCDIGASAIKTLLKKIDLKQLQLKLSDRFKKVNSKHQKTKIATRLDVINSFCNSNNKPEWMILDIIPVIPPDLRPMVQLEGGRFATSDINDLYRRIINRNNRLKRLIELNAPDIIIRNEKRMLQEAVDALFDNGRRGKAVTGAGNRPLKSLADMLKGKQGRFRQNLLGKRVDYSGRSVIVIGPKLKMNQCGLPKIMALELFKPFIMNKLVERKHVNNINGAKKLVEKPTEQVWDVLDEVIQDHPVLLNRAPTLHRLGIQAFEPVLIEGKAIRLHPLVCMAFNADFDGDQMAVHVPLTKLAQIEAKMLMLSTNNILNPSNGRPLVVPTQDMVLGLYFLTREPTEEEDNLYKKKCFTEVNELVISYKEGKVEEQQRVVIRIEKNGKVSRIETTVGRVILNDSLPENIDFINEEINKKNIEKIIDRIYAKHGTYTTVNFLDAIKQAGFEASTRSASSIGIGDLELFQGKYEIIDKYQKEVDRINRSRLQGRISEEERYNTVVEKWNEANNEITAKVKLELKKSLTGNKPLPLMVQSGARGSVEQIRQLVGMRGLMHKPSGKTIEIPIKSSFKEGLTVLEYFISTHGARKGLSDTALKTSTAGYLTRRLVDVSQDVVIREEDCGTLNGTYVKSLKSGENEIVPLIDRIIGRVALDDVHNSSTGELIVQSNEEITKEIADKIFNAKIEKIRIRTVLKCESKEGICAKCYGRNLATGKMVNVGEAVGIIAAQSIGEPGTQLTMRTFHTGGVVSGGGIKDAKFDYEVEVIEIPKKVIEYNNETISLRQGTIVVRRIINRKQLKETDKVVMHDGFHVEKGDVIGKTADNKDIKSSAEGVFKFDFDSKTIFILGDEQQINVKPGAKVKVQAGEILPENTLIAEIDTFNNLIITENTGIIEFVDIIPERTLKEEHDPVTGMIINKVVEDKEKKLHPRIKVNGDVEKEYDIPYGAILNVSSKNEISSGGILAKIPSELSKTKDITGGLPKVEELVEARIKKQERAVITEIDGIVKIEPRKGSENFRKITIKSKFDEKSYKVPLGKYLLVHSEDEVKAGDPLVEGTINPHDILRVKGEEALQEFMILNIQEIYRSQGVIINDKHFEIIVRQMLKKVKIDDPGDSQYQINMLVDKSEVIEENQLMIAENKKPALVSPQLLGITKSSIGTNSFISAASFQDTRKVLTASAIKSNKDELKGLKENVIIGHLITAGTGLPMYREEVYSPDEVIEKVSSCLNDLEDDTEKLSRFDLNVQKLIGNSQDNDTDIY